MLDVNYNLWSTQELAKVLGLSLTVPTDRKGIKTCARPRSYFLQIAKQQLEMEERIKNIG